MKQLKKPNECLNINEIRHEIDKLDKEIIRLFAIRDEFVKEIVTFKDDEKGVIANERKNHVINERVKLASGYGLNPEIFKKIFTLLIEDNIKKELALLSARKENSKIKS